MLLIIGQALTASTAVSATTLSTELVMDGFSEPVFLTSPPGDTTRLFIVEKGGTIKIIKNGALVPQAFLDISGQISSYSERGLLGLAFHPDYAENGYFYVNYTDQAGDLKISRFAQSSNNPDSADKTSELIILEISQPESNHNGGTLAFGPNDRYLYIGVGDGGGSGDNHGTIGNGQDSTSLLGTILRLDVDGGLPYAIPADNPFVGRTGQDEIWAFGLRNPWRMSFDRKSGDLYIGDVGQDRWEEVDYQPAGSQGGENYGWRLKEGNQCFNPSINCDPGGLTDPIVAYGHEFGCSVIGGYVYRGCRVPDLRGTYFYADWCSGRIWSLRFIDGAVVDSTERTAELAPGGGRSIGNPTSFGEDERGEIYILDNDGEIYRIVPGEPVISDCDLIGCCDNPGDANDDQSVNIGDAVYVLNFVFKEGPAALCSLEADTNSDCAVNVGDAVYLINFVLRDGEAPLCNLCP